MTGALILLALVAIAVGFWGWRAFLRPTPVEFDALVQGLRTVERRAIGKMEASPSQSSDFQDGAEATLILASNVMIGYEIGSEDRVFKHRAVIRMIRHRWHKDRGLRFFLILMKEITRQLTSGVPGVEPPKFSVFDSKSGEFLLEFELSAAEQSAWRAKFQ